MFFSRLAGCQDGIGDSRAPPPPLPVDVDGYHLIPMAIVSTSQSLMNGDGRPDRDGVFAGITSEDQTDLDRCGGLRHVDELESAPNVSVFPGLREGGAGQGEGAHRVDAHPDQIAGLMAALIATPGIEKRQPVGAGASHQL